jgi:hypothetical protein
VASNPSFPHPASRLRTISEKLSELEMNNSFHRFLFARMNPLSRRTVFVPILSGSWSDVKFPTTCGIIFTPISEDIVSDAQFSVMELPITEN